MVTRAAVLMLRRPFRPVSQRRCRPVGEPGVGDLYGIASLRVMVTLSPELSRPRFGNIRPGDDRGFAAVRCAQHHSAGGHVHRNDGSDETAPYGRRQWVQGTVEPGKALRAPTIPTPSASSNLEEKSQNVASLESPTFLFIGSVTEAARIHADEVHRLRAPPGQQVGRAKMIRPSILRGS